MALKANALPSKGSKFPRQPSLGAGGYPVRLVQVLDLGLQTQRPYKGEEKLPEYELGLTYEFLDEFMKDEDGSDIEDKPRWLSETVKFLPLSSDLATSTKRYEALDPQNVNDGDWAKLLGTPGVLTITVSKPNDNGETRNYIAALSPMREKEAQKAPALVNEPKTFDLDNPDMTIFKSLPQWLQDKIISNLNYGGSKLEKALSGTTTSTDNTIEIDDEIPNAKEEAEAESQDW